MSTFLVGILYHEPERRHLYNLGVIEDFESSTGIFIEAATAEEALKWGEEVGRQLLKVANNDASLIWEDFGHCCWIEEDPSKSPWSHCLSFFQSIRIGEWPNLDAMGTEAYVRWEGQNGHS